MEHSAAQQTRTDRRYQTLTDKIKEMRERFPDLMRKSIVQIEELQRRAVAVNYRLGEGRKLVRKQTYYGTAFSYDSKTKNNDYKY